ncbi:ABC transporter substrate-binding protein [Microvirga antarctica]|uniref:ABC transporter substrate-binding protein n=1 Tax=Microvirga antarctica TaxID=2819233 RepID=UPI001B30998F|nr:ABC transporter substrate-binding protein [Microvirga antarctica]
MKKFSAKPLAFSSSVVLATLIAVASTSPVSADDIKIGVPLSLTGPVAFAGTKMKDAMELAFDEVNSSGFLGTTKLVPVFADDRSNQPQGISVTQQLVLRDKVSAIVGYTASNICQASLPVAQELKTPTLQADCVVPGLNKIGNYVYSAVRPSDVFVEQTIDKLVAARKIKTAAILYQRDNPVFVNLQPIVAKAFERNGVKIVANEAVTSGGDSDFSAQLTSIANGKPDVMAILLFGGQVGPAMVQARQAGMKDTIFLGEQNFDSVEVRRVAGPNAEGSIFPSHWFAASPVPANVKFVKDYTERFKREPDTFSANGYNAVWLLAQVIKKAGSGDREAIRTAMETIGDMDTVFGTAGKTRFEDRQVTLTPFFFTVDKAGKAVPAFDKP